MMLKQAKEMLMLAKQKVRIGIWRNNMDIRKATGNDAQALKVLYFEHLTAYPPEEEQDMTLWSKLLDEFAQDENMHLLVAEENGKVVSSVQMAIVESLTHNVRPFAIVENVVTHLDYRNKGYASALLESASQIAKERGCYKISLETGSNIVELTRFDVRGNKAGVDVQFSAETEQLALCECFGTFPWI